MSTGAKVQPKGLLSSALKNVTPTRLRLLFFGTSALAVLFALLAINTVSEHRQALDTVGHNATPSVVAAQRMQAAAYQMDGRLADELLCPDKDVSAMTILDYEKGRAILSRQLLAASKNITYGNAEEIPIEKIQLNLGRYEMQAQRTRDLFSSGLPDQALASYRTAYDTIRKDIVSNAKALDKANVDILETTYGGEIAKSALTCGLVLLFGIFLICVLGVTQIYLRNHFRRRLSPPLLAAILFTIVFVNNLYSEVRQSAQRLRHAKEDSYDSISALLSAQSSVYAANAAQSRFLLDRANSARYQKEFVENVESVARFTEGHNLASAIDTVEKSLTSETRKLNIPGMSGTLAVEFANIEYEGEGMAAFDALKALNEFVLADRKMRELEKSGAHEEAVKVCLGYEPGRVKYTLVRFDDAVARALAINQEHFEEQIVSAAEDLKGLAMLAQLFALVIVICAYLALNPRLREYH